MGNISYTAHVSNKKSAITSKSKLAAVAKHNLRKYKSSDYSKDKISLLSTLNDIENQDLEDEEKLLIRQLRETLEKCFQTNESNMDEKIKEPGKKVIINGSDKYIDEINEMIVRKNDTINKHNNLVDNYQEEKKKLISDIWVLIAKENSTLISQHRKWK